MPKIDKSEIERIAHMSGSDPRDLERRRTEQQILDVHVRNATRQALLGNPRFRDSLTRLLGDDVVRRIERSTITPDDVAVIDRVVDAAGAKATDDLDRVEAELIESLRRYVECEES